ATWRDGHYRSDAERGGRYSADAGRTRGLWAAWRDRGAVAAAQAIAYAAAETKRADALAVRVKELEADSRRLDSGVIALASRDEYGDAYMGIRSGIDLRDAIDTAITFGDAKGGA
ncbi:MAG: hypothetical protein KA144_02120, partial [Xanthomonadaceae bacterium]|nr:hypothetical protein [Xanthomonadaceae bacterium]